jgi:hypothetical protein
VISEATALRMLVRFYGWVVVEPGHLRRYRGAPDQHPARHRRLDIEDALAAADPVVTVAPSAAVA